MNDFTAQVSPRKVMESVNRGFKRHENFRQARLMFLKAYTGPYYGHDRGGIGQEPLNLIFNAIRVLVPNIVMSFPKHSIHTPYLADKQYADLLSLALDQNDKSINIRDTYRRVLVDAIFTLGIMKTGLCQSDTVYAISDSEHIDPGTVYTEVVDFDNFVADPDSKEHLFRDARYLGDRIRVPRQQLLESGLYRNDLIEQLPSCADDRDHQKRAQGLSRDDLQNDNHLEEEVEIVELWVPSANAVLTVPGNGDGRNSSTVDDYLRVEDFYGVKEGPYTLLALTPPVPGNPLPIPAVGIWYDLHILANRMAKKIVDQAERQKDVIAYRRAAADDAEELRNARDGETVAVDDPDAVKTLNFGGQENSNEVHLAQLQNWFNQMAGNPNQMGGQQQGADTATGTMILQNNAQTSLEDMKDAVYQSAQDEGRRRCWYLHTDPMMNLPIAKRQQQPAQYAFGPTGPIMVQPPSIDEVQIILTPEMRSGEFIDFTFTIEPESMGRKDSHTRFAQAIDFCTKIMPAVLTSAQTAMALGLPFSAKAMMMRLAKEAGIDWMDEVFYDPEFQMQMMQQMMAGPQAANSKGVVGPASPSAIQQNGQPANVGAGSTSPFGEAKQQFQEGANQGQQMVKAGY